MVGQAQVARRGVVDKMVDYMRTLCVPLCLVALLGGCAKYDHVAFSNEKGATDRGDLSNESISIVQGFAVASTALAIDSDGDEMDGLTLHADDAAPLGVAPGPDEKSYVFYARAVGNGVVRVRIDGDQVATIPVTVLPQ